MSSLLTIIVPTYNRASRLKLLLTTLHRESTGLEKAIRVIVSDNGSTDRTAEVVASFIASYPNSTAARHPVNVGPDENFCSCVEQTRSRYFWLIGDDDLPKAGVIRLIVDLLIRESPDLVYVESDPRDEVVDNEPDRPVTDLLPVVMSRMGFARRVQVYSTFISGMIVNRETYAATEEAQQLRRFNGTNLVQLGWVMAVLKAGQRYIHVRQGCIMSKQGNSGGYSLMTVFGKNFPNVVAAALGARSRMTRAMVGRCLIGHLPNMIWSLRFGHIGDFRYENVSEILRPALRSYPSYWLLIEPISRLPQHWARRMVRVAEQTARTIAAFDRRLERRQSDRRQ